MKILLLAQPDTARVFNYQVKLLQWESLKPYFDPPHIARNFFVHTCRGHS
jgi:hypothetical protein